MLHSLCSHTWLNISSTVSVHTFHPLCLYLSFHLVCLYLYFIHYVCTFPFTSYVCTCILSALSVVDFHTPCLFHSYFTHCFCTFISFIVSKPAFHPLCLSDRARSLLSSTNWSTRGRRVAAGSSSRTVEVVM